MTASMYPADTIPASQPACVLVRDQSSMNCGRSAGTVEYPAKPRTSAAHTATTVAAEGLGAELAELTVYQLRPWIHSMTLSNPSLSLDLGEWAGSVLGRT